MENTTNSAMVMAEQAMAKDELISFLIKDLYKESHIPQLPGNLDELLETWTPRGTRIEGINHIVFYNLQAYIIEWLMGHYNKHFFDLSEEMVLSQYRMFMSGMLFDEDPNVDAILSLHRLGYLPIEIRAVKEGTRVPMRCPAFTFRSTHKDFPWVAAMLETLTSSENWSPMTVATIADELNRVTKEYAMKTTGSIEGCEYMMHDFSMRGMSGINHAASAGAGHLLSGCGTDTIPAVHKLWKYYAGNIEMGGIGCGVPATEHMVMCVGMDENRSERDIIKKLLTVTYPNGILSAVLDADDFWKNITEVLPSLKAEIMARDGKFVCRPDSGNPADIICGTVRYNSYRLNGDELDINDIIITNYDKYVKIDGEMFLVAQESFDGGSYSLKSVKLTTEEKGLVEVLYEQFGGTITEQGYILLDSHIGAIYGDSITMDVQKDIYSRLDAKGFSNMNVVLGIGSFQYNMNTRDTFNQAFKAVNSVIDGVDVALFKDPKTDTEGMKKSQRGRVVVYRNVETGKITYADGLTQGDADALEEYNLLEPVFRNGVLLRFQTLDEIREIMKD